MTSPAVNSVVDPFTADTNSIPSATNTKLTANTGFTFGNSTPKTADDDITKPVTPVSDHSDGHDNNYSGSSAQYSYMPAAGKPGITSLSDIPKEKEADKEKESGNDAAGSSNSTANSTTPSSLNPTGVFSTIPGLGLGVNASSPTKSSLPEKPPTPLTGPAMTTGTSNTAKTALGGPLTGEKRKAEDTKLEDTKADSLNKPEASISASRSLQATMEDSDADAEAKFTSEPLAKKAKTGSEPEAPSLSSAAAHSVPTDATAEPAAGTSSSSKPAETEAPAETIEKKKPGRPKKGQAKKKAPVPVGQTARKTRSQGPVA